MGDVVNEVEEGQVSDAGSVDKTEAVTTGSTTSTIVPERRLIGHHEARTNRWGYFFVAPFVIVFCFFNLWPTLYTFILSFTDLQGITNEFHFIGFQQFGELVKDKYFWVALSNTFIIWGINFVPQLGLALILAIWLSDIRLNLAGKGLFRAVVYMPNLLTAVSVAFLFRSLFGYGGHAQAPVNQFLGSLNIRDTVLVTVTDADGMITLKAVSEAFNFFRSVAFTRGLTAFIQWWMWYGHTLIMMMAGITSISVSLFESATVDGASGRQVAWFITLPLLRPMMLYILVTSMIGGMQMFDVPFLLTDGWGGVERGTLTTTMYQYNMAFGRGVNKFAYGAAVSVGIFIVTMVLAMLIFFFLQDRSELKKAKKGEKA